MGSGLALFDADGDVDLDLYVVDGGPLPGSPPSEEPVGDRLFLNRGDGTFEQSAGIRGEESGYGMGVTVGDFDGDGRRDLYVMNYGPNRMLRNLGDGRFEAVSIGADDPTWSVSGAFFDLEGDGDLDLYVADYLDYDLERDRPCHAGDLEIYCSPEQFDPITDRLFRNDDGRFTEVTTAAGLREDGRGMGVAVGDLNQDGRPDLYVTNDRSPNFLYLNRGDGTLREVGTEAGVAYSEIGMAEGGMGAVIADLSGGGFSEIFLTNFQKEPNRYYRPIGEGFYEDESLSSGLGFPSRPLVGWGVVRLDAEGDGDLDLAVANGHVFDNAADFLPGSSFAMPDQLYLNQGNGRFEASELPGPPLSSRGLVSGDLDGDGDPDLVVTANGGELRVLRNEMGRPGRYLVIQLIGRAPSTDAFGASLSARVGERRLRRQLFGGGSYASHSDDRVYLGLGEHRRVEGVRVEWPDGTIEELGEMTGGQLVVWKQGRGVIERRPLRRP